MFRLECKRRKRYFRAGPQKRGEIMPIVIVSSAAQCVVEQLNAGPSAAIPCYIVLLRGNVRVFRSASDSRGRETVQRAVWKARKKKIRNGPSFARSAPLSNGTATVPAAGGAAQDDTLGRPDVALSMIILC